jgi:hypothetical protein
MAVLLAEVADAGTAGWCAKDLAALDAAIG